VTGAVRLEAASEGPDLRSVGGGARRVVNWAELDASSLSSSQREVIGSGWRARMIQEHLAVGAFALLARELAEEGCGIAVLSLVTRASSDEVRHADICRRFAVALLGEAAVPSRVRGLPKVPMHEGARPTDRVLLHMVEMCCLSETLTGVYLTEMLARTTDPMARAAVESLLEDEVDHGRVGWGYLAERAQEGRGSLAVLSAALPPMLERTFARVLDAASRASDDDDPALERLAHLGPRAGGDVYRAALRDVIFPGFAALGVEVAASRALAESRGWV
jgi:hypothetical protein